MKEKIILASESPRRKELLKNVGCEFEVIPSGFNEDSVIYDGNNPCLYAMSLAELKAEEVSRLYDDCIVIAADTIVILEGKIYGKPINRSQAENMLKYLSGKCHKVITGICIIKRIDKLKIQDFKCTDVWFDDLSDEKIEKYLDTGEYKDKAGSYGIQGKGSLLVKKIDGCFYNVMGLPMNTLEIMLNKIGISLFM